MHRITKFRTLGSSDSATFHLWHLRIAAAGLSKWKAEGKGILDFACGKVDVNLSSFLRRWWVNRRHIKIINCRWRSWLIESKCLCKDLLYECLQSWSLVLLLSTSHASFGPLKIISLGEVDFVSLLIASTENHIHNMCCMCICVCLNFFIFCGTKFERCQATPAYTDTSLCNYAGHLLETFRCSDPGYKMRVPKWLNDSICTRW